MDTNQQFKLIICTFRLQYHAQIISFSQSPASKSSDSGREQPLKPLKPPLRTALNSYPLYAFLHSRLAMSSTTLQGRSRITSSSVHKI